MSYGSTPPPMSGGYGQFDAGNVKPRTSGVAIAALVCSLLFCIPFITSAAGALLGLIGIAVTGKPNVKGRALAVVALLLGLIGLAGWSYGTWVVVDGYVRPFATMAEFTGHLAKDDLAKAGALTAPPFDNAVLPELVAKVKGYGKFVSLKDPKTGQMPIAPVTVNGQKGYRLAGVAEFENGAADVSLDLVKTPGGWRIVDLQMKDVTPKAPTTVPVQDFGGK